jgi:hypothetical protein
MVNNLNPQSPVYKIVKGRFVDLWVFYLIHGKFPTDEKSSAWLGQLSPVLQLNITKALNHLTRVYQITLGVGGKYYDKMMLVE